MFAIHSLRSLYTFVSESMSELEYLDRAVGLVLGFIGAKMIAGFAGLEISTPRHSAWCARSWEAGWFCRCPPPARRPRSERGTGWGVGGCNAVSRSIMQN